MNEIQESRTREIGRLHEEIVGHLKQSLEKAIRIGELLSEQKASLKHGEWGDWIKQNLPFTDRTARNYMRVYAKRDRLKTETLSDLTDAYRLLALHEPSAWIKEELGKLAWWGEMFFGEDEWREILIHFGFDPDKVDKRDPEIKFEPPELDEENWDFDESVKKCRRLEADMRESILKSVRALASLKSQRN